MNIKKISFENYAFYLALFYFIFVNIFNVSNPILERHSFRQTQTAITAYYILDTLNLSYVTPVLGDQESIPFEFPIYQVIVAFTSNLLNANLSSVGRLISLFFSLMILFPLKGIFEKFNISPNYYKLTVAAILFSPVYSFWSGTFMIESTALFFAITGAFYGLKSAENFNFKNFIFAFIFLTLALLQKVTTAIFLYGVIILYLSLFCLKNSKWRINGKNCLALFTGLIPFVIAYSWIFYTDWVKSNNSLAILKLTTKSLGSWNYGSIAQRLSEYLYLNVIYLQDILPNTLFGFLAIISLVFAIYCRRSQTKIFLFVLLFLYCAPLLVFTNLYWVHDYYHYANTIYLICFSYLGFLYFIDGTEFIKYKYVILTISYVLSISVFGFEYAPAKFGNAGQFNSIQIADFVKSSTSNDQKLVVFGYDWSSEIHYYSERKGLAVPDWVDQIAVVQNLDDYVLDRNKFIVVCPSSGKDFNGVLGILKERYFLIDSKYGCNFFNQRK